VLVVLAIVLLAVGVVTLGLGLFGNSLAWVFVSVGTTAAALVPLFVLYRRGRHAGWPEEAEWPRPEGEWGEADGSWREPEGDRDAPWRPGVGGSGPVGGGDAPSTGSP